MSVIIKRYRNRKLYNTHSKRYVTLEEVEELIKDREEVQVIDNPTGNDITSATLSQIIFELEKNHAGFLPINLLISLVQSSGNRIDEIRRNIFNSLNLSHHYDVEIERRVNLLIESGELGQEAGTKVLGKLLTVSSMNEDFQGDIEERILEFLRQRQIPTKSEFQTLTQKIEALSKKLEDINSGEAK